jgi:hypothetical protein
VAKERKPPSPFSGRWRITSFDQLDQEFVDAEVEEFFDFGPDNFGSFQFSCVQGEIDYRSGIRDGRTSVEFSWEGHDEMDPATGRGWAVLDGEEIEGMIFFHRGDDYEFKARRSKRR